MTPGHSHSVVTRKYAPTPDPRWTPDIEAEFFAWLDKRHPHASTGRRWSEKAVSPSPSKEALLREYATETLNAQRISRSYLTTLSAVLGNLASAERGRSECSISQRDERLGPRSSLRTIQAQLEAAGVLFRVTRAQGHGFVGDVFIYRPSKAHVPREVTVEELERSYRAGERRQTPCMPPVNIVADDVRY